MSDNNPIEQVAFELATLLPEARITLSAPKFAHGWWWLDVHSYGHLAVVIWTERSGLHVSRARETDTPFDRPNYNETTGTDWPFAESPIKAAILVLCELLKAQNEPVL